MAQRPVGEAGVGSPMARCHGLLKPGHHFLVPSSKDGATQADPPRLGLGGRARVGPGLSVPERHRELRSCKFPEF